MKSIPANFSLPGEIQPERLGSCPQKAITEGKDIFARVESPAQSACAVFISHGFKAEAAGIRPAWDKNDYRPASANRRSLPQRRLNQAEAQGHLKP
jgi:hypothetical protein